MTTKIPATFELAKVVRAMGKDPKRARGKIRDAGIGKGKLYTGKGHKHVYTPKDVSKLNEVLGYELKFG